MEAEPISETALALARRLREDEEVVRRSLHHVVRALGTTRAHALTDQALALDAGAGVVRMREGTRVRLTPSGVFLTLAREAGWQPPADEPATRFVRASPPPRVLPPSRPSLPQGVLHVTIKMTEVPKLVRKGEEGLRTYALETCERVITFTLRPKAYDRFNTFLDAKVRGALLVINGRIGRPTPEGFELDDPAVQLVEPGQRPLAKNRGPDTEEQAEGRAASAGT